MTTNQLLAKLLNCGYHVCGWDCKSGEIDLSKDNKYVMIVQREMNYGYFGYAIDDKWIINYKELG